MKEIEYKDFSLHTHKKNWKVKKPNVCQFELTFGCALHCRHCYSDCYNKPSYIAKQLKTHEVKRILDKVYAAGVLWVCFTGGDPLAREDFLEIYAYAKHKGFLITLFTNAVSMTQKIASYLTAYPPFAIEITVNAVSKVLYEHIAQVQGSFDKMKKGIKMIRDNGLPLKIKTQITKDNMHSIPEIKRFVEDLGLDFCPSFRLYPRLNRDTTPCSLRIPIQEFLDTHTPDPADCLAESAGKTTSADNLVFRCAAGGGDGFHIDPYGNIFLCNLIRQPSVNALNKDINQALNTLEPFFKGRRFKTDSPCRSCDLKDLCRSCPGIAYLEKADMESPVPYFCNLAKMMQENKTKEVFHVQKAKV